MKTFGKLTAACAIAFTLLAVSVYVVPAAVQGVMGLAVAQSSKVYNDVKDYAAGDGIVKGILDAGCMFWNGSSGDRCRGTITNGLLVDVSRMPGSSQTPADAFANPSTFQGTWALPGLFNGTTWNRHRDVTIGDGVAPAGIAANSLYVADSIIAGSSTYNRIRGVGGNVQVMNTQGRAGTVTQQSVSAANTAVSITITGFANVLTVLNGVDAYCSAGTSSITVARSTGPTTIWSTPATAVGTTLFSKEWPVPMTSTVTGDSFTVTLAACGAANTGTLMVRGGIVL